ncbi:hypothetical protein BaRGS_00036863 [Batillaria attramentaria]|uniref:SEA domain-containing protein n=1 Tax=Batillaria attramentaria TaxID=370345 RepID=A0ABD0JAL6_9CAEN
MANDARFTARLTVVLLLSGATCLTSGTSQTNINGVQFTHPQLLTVKTNYNETFFTNSENQSPWTTTERFAFTDTPSESTSSVTSTADDAVAATESLMMSRMYGTNSTELPAVHVESHQTQYSTIKEVRTENISVSPQTTSRKTGSPETHTYVRNLTMTTINISLCFRQENPQHFYAFEGYVTFNIDDLDINQNPSSIILGICSMVFHVPNGSLMHVQDIQIRGTKAGIDFSDQINGELFAYANAIDGQGFHEDAYSFSQSVRISILAEEIGLLGFSFQFRFTAVPPSMSVRPQLEVVFTSPAGGKKLINVVCSHKLSRSV